jgi:hypothetical protein
MRPLQILNQSRVGWRVLSVSCILLASAACSDSDPTAVPGGSALPSPAADERTVSVVPVVPSGVTLPRPFALGAGVRATEVVNGVGRANLGRDNAQIVSVLAPSGAPVLLAPAIEATIGGTAERARVDVSTTAEALALLSPVLATTDADSAAAILIQIRNSSAFGALRSAVESQLRRDGVLFTGGAAPPALTAAIRAVVAEVAAIRGPSTVSASLVPPTPDRLSGVEVKILETGALGPRVELTNRRRRWLSVVVRSSDDGTIFSRTTPEVIFPQLVGASGLLSFIFDYPTSIVPLPASAAVSRVKVFGPGFAGSLEQVRSDPDLTALAAPVVLTVLFQYGIPTFELVSGAKLVSVPAASAMESGVYGVLVTSTIECLAESSSAGPAVVRALLTAALAGGSASSLVEALFMPTVGCVIEAGISHPEAVAGLLGVAGATAAINNSLVVLRLGLGAFTAVELGLSVGQLFTSEPLMQFDIRNTDVLFSGNANVFGIVSSATTGLPIVGATVRLGDQQGALVRSSSTNGAGEFSFPALGPGTYRLEAVASGYVANAAENVKLFSIAAGDVVRADFGLPPTGSTQSFGSVGGRVYDASGAPATGVEVTLSGGTQTNGVFRATTTGSNGAYAFAGVALRDANGQLIPSFTVRAVRPGVSSASRTATLVANFTLANVDLTLQPITSSTVFFDGFETASGWTTTGLWNRSTLTGISNSAVPLWVSLAPDDATGGALPPPREGTWAFWYGQASTGNFIGTASSSNGPNSGGRSTTSNAGLLTSPTITLPSAAAVLALSFDTWFEIESQNPRESGYDRMSVEVQDATTGAVTLLGRLNPWVDPTVSPREHIPFTSGGFNRAPVWRSVEADLTPFRGRTVRLRFRFETVDEKYNGFRGWIIDALRVSQLGSAVQAESDGSRVRLDCDSLCQSRSAQVPVRR